MKRCTTTKFEPAGLYQVVYGSKAVRVAVFVVLMFFILHPAVPVFAAEDTDNAETVSLANDPVAESSKEQAAEESIAEPVVEEAEDMTEEPEVLATEPEEAAAEEVFDPVIISNETEGVDSEITAVVDSEEVASESIQVSVGSTTASTKEVVENVSSTTSAYTTESTVSVGTTTASSTEQNVGGDGGSYEESSSTVDDVAASDIATNDGDATPTQDSSADTPPVHEVVVEAVEEGDVPGTSTEVTVPEPAYYEVVQQSYEDDSHYSFLKNQCVSMGDGAYHCFDTSEGVNETSDEVLYVARDGDGDKELYMNTKKGVVQITDNTLDDDAPFYDALSDSIVWQRQEAGLYRIYEYQNGTEVAVSPAGVNAMEPHRSGEYTVWQAWLNDAWQVVLKDVDGKTITLPSRGGQNIAPQVEGGYVIWSETNGAEHSVAVYEIATGLMSYINDSENARVMNPRFVLVYDTRFANGDVVTQGYDTETGEVIPLAAAAPVEPTELPSATQTGEEVALLTNKSSSRDEYLELDDLSGTASSSLAKASSTTAAADDVVVSTDVATTTLPLTDFDLIVEPYTATNTATSTQL